MGREAQCTCTWNGATAPVKAQIEPPYLILRGGLRKRIPIASLRKVEVDGTILRFSGAEGQFALALGAVVASRWATALLKPPPDLAKKLGITPQSVVRRFGPIDDPSLQEALEQALATSKDGADLIVARVEAPPELAHALAGAAADLDRGVAMWVLYRKGPGQALGEARVRSAALAAGLVDTKVAAVSSALTGLRFVRRRKP